MRALCPSLGLAALAAIILLARALAAAAESSAPGNPCPLTLTYRHPADPKHWATEGLPIGNGRLGAMLFGGTASERIQFNETSLWGGANNWDGGYDCGDTGFGGYRNFGDLWLDFGKNLAGRMELTSPSHQAQGSSGSVIANTVDGKADTKWCIENPGQAVVWQIELPKAQRVDSYALTSANDVPARDPKVWALSGSQDSVVWTELDSRALPAPFEKRGETRSFAVANPGAYRFYRFSFTPTPGVSHFQVAEIALSGVNLSQLAPSPAAPPVPGDYRRELDISTGIHRVSFTSPEGVKITREAFASRPGEVMVFRYTADGKGAFSGRIRLQPGQNGSAITADGNGISFSGTMANNLRYAGGLRVMHEGGSVRADGAGQVFDRCDSLTLLLDARTDYKADFHSGWRGEDPKPALERELAAAAQKPFADLRREHVADFSRLMGAVSLNLGGSTPEQKALPTDERLKCFVDEGRFGKGDDDPDLEAQIFQMGRYLLVSSSRPGSLLANLQGLWNDSNNPMWASDYHNNINIEMNYWPAETTNLSECAVPLIDFIVAAEEPCRIATRKAFGDKTRGWTARTSQGPFGGNGWEWNIPSSAWYARHVFEHWAFSQDRTYLRETAYPLLKEICQFWEDRLKRMPDGLLMAPNGWSPEHGPREDGVMMDQEIIWDLFQNYREAAAALGVDADYQMKVADLQAHLAPNKIGKWGQLQEWQEDIDSPGDRHRHSSQLFALFPGSQISMEKTPELARAARVSLLARSNDNSDVTGKPWNPSQMDGESIYGWVWSWRAAMWARLGDARRAHAMLWGKAGNTAPNMLGLNTPYFRYHQELIQLDNSFGTTAAMAEMLMQSHTGDIRLLPALPSGWAKEGSFRGLRARGGFIVDCAWADGRVTRFVITSTVGGHLRVLDPWTGKIVEGDTRAGQIFEFKPSRA